MRVVYEVGLTEMNFLPLIDSPRPLLRTLIFICNGPFLGLVTIEQLAFCPNLKSLYLNGLCNQKMISR
jgi:hypothetical protein